MKRNLTLLITLFSALGFVQLYAKPTKSDQPPNVLMICVDDLHPFVAKGKFPYIKTPHIDKLKQSGIYFINGACSTPVCNPSRSSFFSGLHAHTTGAYMNGSDGWNRSKLLQNIRNIPEMFGDNGYVTWGAGKILHNPLAKEREADMWDNFPVYKGGFGPFAKDEKDHYGSRFRSIEAWEDPDTDFPDVKNANGAIEFLQKDHDKPFFLYYGLWRPHSPYTAPKRFFDIYNESDFDYPVGRVEGDMDDVPELGKLLTNQQFDHYVKEGMATDEIMKKFLYAYAANTSFADWNVGRVIEALENSPYADNTIIIFFSDNGFHTTEKNRWGKATLWDLSANISLIIRTPNSTPAVSEATVSLTDLFPTLADYCGLETNGQRMDGDSMVPLLENPDADWNRPSFTSYGIEYSSVRNEEYRYIRYPDETEELYRYADDPMELRNLANDPAFDSVKEELKKHIPKDWAPTTGGRLEVPHDFDKVMRPKGEWFGQKTTS